MSESLDATATPSQSAKKRRRPALACTECRRRKMKCDQQKPCNNCSRPRRFLCIYPGESESTGPGTDLRGLTLTRRVSSIEPRHATVSSNTANRSTSRNRREYARLPTGNSSLREPVTPSSESVGSRGPVSASRSSDLQHKASSIATSDASNSNHVSGSPAIAHNSATKEHPRFERRFASQSSWVNNTTLVSIYPITASIRTLTVQAHTHSALSESSAGEGSQPSQGHDTRQRAQSAHHRAVVGNKRPISSPLVKSINIHRHH